MAAVKPQSGKLRVIKGGRDASGGKKAKKGRSAHILLIILALFLLSQLLLGWIWGTLNRRAGKYVLAEEGTIDIYFTAGGILTFEEELVFAPWSGFVYYYVNAGERVPLGKEVAVISSLPRENLQADGDKESEEGNYLQRFRRWLLDDRGLDEQGTAEIFFPHNREWEITAPRAGMVSLRVDGWEMFGPSSSFVYLEEEAYREKEPSSQFLQNGGQVSRFAPIMSIINNYRWYYSAVLPANPGKQVAAEASVKLLFDFAPLQPVWGDIVEARVNDEGKMEITWSIDQAAGDFYNHRWASAKIVYGYMEGVLLPKDVIIETEGETGVYMLEKGRIVWREVKLLAEQEGSVLVDNLSPYERVIARPGRVKDGQRLLW